MNNTLNQIPNRFDLSPSQLVDLRRLKYSYNILASRGNFGLTSADLDSFILYSQGGGIDAVQAINILAVNFDSIYSPRYYIPGEISPRKSNNIHNNVTPINLVNIYPNPSRNLIYFNLDKNINSGIFILKDLNNLYLDYFKINSGLNEIYLNNDIQSGIYIYNILLENKLFSSGKLVVIK